MCVIYVIPVRCDDITVDTDWDKNIGGGVNLYMNWGVEKRICLEITCTIVLVIIS